MDINRRGGNNHRNGFFWIAAMKRFDQSYAYPFISLNFVFIFIASIYMFNEPFSLLKLAGVSLITLGVFFITSISK